MAVATLVAMAVEWDETGRVDTGLLGLTTKHLYFAGSKKRFRVRYDRIVTFEPYEDGVGIMREAQTAKPQTFVTGDGWFAFNMATNLARCSITQSQREDMRCSPILQR